MSNVFEQLNPFSSDITEFALSALGKMVGANPFMTFFLTEFLHLEAAL